MVKYQSERSKTFAYFASILPKGSRVKFGVTCSVDVWLPLRRDHPFWTLHGLDARSVYDWDREEDGIALTVDQYGENEESASWYATCHAKDIIRDIRRHLLPELSSSSLVKNLGFTKEKVDMELYELLKAGGHVNEAWRLANNMFTARTFTTTFCESGIRFLSSMPFSLPLNLVNYYKVFRRDRVIDRRRSSS